MDFATRARAPLSVSRHQPSQWLLVLTIGGRDYMLTDGGPASVPSRAGDAARVFEPGLSPLNLDRVIELFGTAPQPRSVSLQMQLPLAMGQQIEGGRSVYSATGELSRIYSGQDWEDRLVYVDGSITEMSWGDRGEPVVATLEERPGDDRGVVIGETERVSSATVPTPSASASAGSDPNIEGAYYPRVIGAPGPGVPLRIVTGGLTYVSETMGSPALLIEDTTTGPANSYKLLIAGGKVEASTCTVFNLTTRSKVARDQPVLLTVDSAGQPVSYIEPTTATRPAEGDELWASWTGGGGMPDPFGTGELTRADHVIRWLLSLSTIRHDPIAIASGLAPLSAYKLAGYVNARVSPWAVLQAEILPLLPVSVSWGAGGLSMRSIVLDQRPDAAVYAIEVGRNAERVTPIRYSPSSAVVNRLTIEYAPSAATGAYTQSVTVTSSADPDITTDSTLRPSPWATASQAVFGVRAQTVQTSWVYDSATAEAMALSMVRRMHAPSMMAAVRVGGEFGGARPGDWVRVTDSGVSWLDVGAFVESVSIDEGDSIVLGLRRYPALGNR